MLHRERTHHMAGKTKPKKKQPLDMLRRMALGLDVPDSVRFTPKTADRELDI